MLLFSTLVLIIEKNKIDMKYRKMFHTLHKNHILLTKLTLLRYLCMWDSF